ncbi:hypothetical protein PAMP_017088 [Pampus punctatissimus]
MAAGFLEEEYYDLQEENDQYKKLISHEKDNLVSLDREDTIKFDEVLCSNMDYYKDIAHLLQQKSTVCSIKEKFNRQLVTQQGIMEKLEEKSTLAFSRSIEAETKRKMQLKILIVHDTKLHSFMEKKFQEIIPLKEDEDSKTRKKHQEHQSGVKRLEMYRQGHSTLVEVTGEKELGQIGQLFIQNEQKNFALINYINKLHNRRNSDILFLEHDNNRHDQQSESHLKDVESEFEKHSCLADSLEKQCVLVQETLDQLMTAITGLVREITQEAAVVTFDNISHFTSVLEESITDLLIHANNVEDEQTGLPPQNLLLANSDLLAEGETVVDTECSRSPALSLKSA